MGVRGIWYWGPPGTGKSHTARTNWPEAYIKTQNKWFDGYDGNESFILEDMDDACLKHYLKIWADKRSCSGKTKGGHVHLQHKVFVVTSNYSIDNLFGENEQMCEAIKRRFVVTHFGAHGFNPGWVNPMAQGLMVQAGLDETFLERLEDEFDDEIEGTLLEWGLED